MILRGVTENLDPPGAGEGGQREARLLGQPQRVRGGRRDRDDGSHPPAIAAFWTMSTETRLVMTMAPPVAEIPSRASAPISLSSALCPADILPARG